jgi:hypothetical protein
MKVKKSPRYPELDVYADGRIYDTVLNKWLNINAMHGCSYKGPVALWSTGGKTYTLQVSKILYEAHVCESELKKDWSIEFKNGDETDIRPENLTKVKKYERDYKVMRNFMHDSWLNGSDDIYML